jgi:hypothetical protein
MSAEKAAATYRADLGDGLIERWSTSDDADHIADFGVKKTSHSTSI